jgi:hypothetical protein
VTRITGILHADLCAFIILRRILPIMRNVLNKDYRENQNTFYAQLLSFENRAVYEIVLKKDYTADIIQCMCIACWIPKSTDTRSEYVILINFPLQQ